MAAAESLLTGKLQLSRGCPHWLVSESYRRDSGLITVNRLRPAWSGKYTPCMVGKVHALRKQVRTAVCGNGVPVLCSSQGHRSMVIVQFESFVLCSFPNVVCLATVPYTVTCVPRWSEGAGSASSSSVVQYTLHPAGVRRP